MDDFSKFISNYPARAYKKGETILLKNERPETLFIIESGMVKTYSITNGGFERVVTIDRKGEDLPIGYAFGLIDRSHFFYQAYTRCVLRLIPRDAYINYLMSDADTLYVRHVRTVKFLLSTLEHIHALEQPTAGQKIAYTLLYIARQVGVMLRPTSELKISMTQQEIANSLGLSRETTNVELKKLETLNLISHSRKSYVLHLDRLKHYLGDE